MRTAFTLIFFYFVHVGTAQTVLNADGPGETYELITSVFAPGYNPIETPDCAHEAFGPHIDEVFDADLNMHVFSFHIHVTPDNDRCKKYDRQRNEIKTYASSPDHLLGIEGETVVYKWKFKLDEDFQCTSAFTHIHQIKSVGGSCAGMPIFTLTARAGSPDKLQLGYAELADQETLTYVDLNPFKGNWIEVNEIVSYGQEGSYKIEINRCDNGESLLSYENKSIVTWRPEAEFVRPKWGIYRSLSHPEDLRDEILLYADFSIEEIDALSNNDLEIKDESLLIYPNPVKDSMFVKGISEEATRMRIFNMDGKRMLEKNIDLQTTVHFYISTYPNGTYVLHLIGKKFQETKVFIVAHE